MTEPTHADLLAAIERADGRNEERVKAVDRRLDRLENDVESLKKTATAGGAALRVLLWVGSVLAAFAVAVAWVWERFKIPH